MSSWRNRSQTLGMLVLYLVSMFRADSKLTVGTKINVQWFINLRGTPHTHTHLVSCYTCFTKMDSIRHWEKIKSHNWQLLMYTTGQLWIDSGRLGNCWLSNWLRKKNEKNKNKKNTWQLLMYIGRLPGSYWLILVDWVAASCVIDRERNMGSYGLIVVDWEMLAV